MSEEIEILKTKLEKLEKEIESLEATVKTNSELYTLLAKQVHEQLNMEPKIPVPYWLEDGAKLPERKKDGDIGYDAYLNEDKVIKAHSAEKVSLGIGMIIPNGYGVHAVNRGGCYLAYGSHKTDSIIESYSIKIEEHELKEDWYLCLNVIIVE